MLTDITVRQAKPKDKAYKISDSGGLYLLGVWSWSCFLLTDTLN
jgi:hypothetical protein